MYDCLLWDVLSLSAVFGRAECSVEPTFFYLVTNTKFGITGLFEQTKVEEGRVV